MELCRFANTDLSVSIIGIGCYGMLDAYGPADDADSIATIHRALDLGSNFLDTSASYGQSHNHRLIGEARDEFTPHTIRPPFSRCGDGRISPARPDDVPNSVFARPISRRPWRDLLRASLAS